MAESTNIGSADAKTTAMGTSTAIEKFTAINSHYLQVNEAASKWARSMGYVYNSINKIENITMKLVKDQQLLSNYNVGISELLNAQVNISEKLQRNFQLSRDSSEDMAAMFTLIGDEKANDLVSTFDQFGKSVQDGASYVESMYKTSSKTGINFAAYSKNLVDNLKLAQQYTFKDGLKGLEEMVKRATELKFNINDTKAVADNIWTKGIEGAIEASAKLQVLGGDFARLADPLSIANEAFTDMGALQERLTDMFGDLATFNKETGEVEVSTYNKMRMRQAAQALGMDYSSVMESIYAQGRRNEIGRQLENYGGIDDDMKRKIMNQGTIENGVAGAVIGDKFFSIDEIAGDQSLQKELVEQGISEEANVRSIAKNVVSIQSQLDGFLKGIGVSQAQLEKEPTRALNTARKKFEEEHPGTYDVIGTVGFGESIVTNVVSPFGRIVEKFGSFVNKFIGGGGATAEHGGYISGMATGGILRGPSHAEGGIMAEIRNKPAVEVEGGEFVVNKKATAENREILEAINNSTLSPSVTPSYDKFENGGVLPGVFGQGIDVIKEAINSLTITPTKDSYPYETVHGKENSQTKKEPYSDNSLKTIEHKLVVDGTIKLEGKDGQLVDFNTLNASQLRDLYNKIITAVQKKIE